MKLDEMMPIEQWVEVEKEINKRSGLNAAVFDQLEAHLDDSDLQGEDLLVSGERRFHAAVQAGLTEVPCIELEVSDEHALEIALIENLQRQDLSAFEEAEGYRTLVEKYSFDPNKFIVEGKGWNEPADAEDPENHALNRRVEISVYSPEPSTRKRVTTKRGSIQTSKPGTKAAQPTVGAVPSGLKMVRSSSWVSRLSSSGRSLVTAQRMLSRTISARRASSGPRRQGRKT